VLTTETVQKGSSIVGRVLASFNMASRRLETLVNACTNPECPRRSVRQALTRKLDGAAVAGQWFCSPACYETGLHRHVSALITSTARSRTLHRARIPLGLMLLSRGHLTHEQLNFALEQHRLTGARVGDILLELNLVTEEQVTSALAAQWGYPIFPSNTAIHHLPVRIPQYLITLHRIMPLHFVEASRRLLLGFADGPDHRILTAVKHILACEVEPCFIAMGEFQRRLQWLNLEATTSEVIFDRTCQVAEIARVAGSYIRQLGAQHANFALSGNHLWVRLTGGKQLMDLLLRFRAC